MGEFWIDVRRGMDFLVNRSKEINKILYGEGTFTSKKVTLEKHPFGSKIPNAELAQKEIKFFGFPEYSDSINTFGSYVAEYLHARISYLRILKMEADQHDSSKHMVFFEIGIANQIFMCGGCTDFSGAGGDANATLQSFFLMLSKLYDIKIIEENVPYGLSKTMRDVLRKIVDPH